MIINHLSPQKFKSTADSLVIRISLGNICVTSCKMTRHKAYCRVVEFESDSNAAFVA